MFDWQFFLLLMSNGILIGLMYALIALGFVLVYKATDAINFAQGEFVMIAGFVVVAFLFAYNAPLWVSVAAGLAAMSGPGLTVELDDAPSETIESSGVKPDFLVVHQQDIQAVANAMWAGGAEAMTIQGQRVISTTGIKCVGNTVVLHGIPYSPPYVITAVGDPASMLTSINESPYIDIYMDYVEDPRYQLGWDVLLHDEVRLPGYDGSLELGHARPAGQEASGDNDDV